MEENATVLGPAAIGAGARIAAGAVVAHATIGPDCVVPCGRIVRDRAWFESGEDVRIPGEGPPLSYGERLARPSLDLHHDPPPNDLPPAPPPPPPPDPPP